MEPKKHINRIQARIDLIYAELKTMGEHGHFDGFEANTDIGEIHYRLAKLRNEINK